MSKTGGTFFLLSSFSIYIIKLNADCGKLKYMSIHSIMNKGSDTNSRQGLKINKINRS